jgi:hypothetical protein
MALGYDGRYKFLCISISASHLRSNVNHPLPKFWPVGEDKTAMVLEMDVCKSM